MTRDLIIIGAGGFARETAWLVERINSVKATWNLLGFMDNDPETIGKFINGYPVLDEADHEEKYQDVWYVCAIGPSKSRRRVVNKYEQAKFATLIDPDVKISKRVEIGAGSIICAGNIITVNITIGKHVIINLDCTIGHDVVMGDFVTLYPSVNVSGLTNIGDCTEIGTGTQIIQMKSIGRESIVGAGAVVIRNVPEKCTVVGNPAKPIGLK